MRRGKNYFVAAAGILLFLSGLCMLNRGEGASAFLTALPYVCIGVGSGLFGHGLSGILAGRTLRKNPGMQKQMEITEKDERNIAIADRAKARAYDAMVFVFAALAITFVLLGVDAAPVLLLVAAYLYVQGYAFYCRCKYDREM